MSLPAAAMMDYASYLLTPHWRRIRFAAIWAAGGRCAVCGSDRELQAHHRTYANLFSESAADLVILCRRCHELYEEARLLPTPPARVEASG